MHPSHPSSAGAAAEFRPLGLLGVVAVLLLLSGTGGALAQGMGGPMGGGRSGGMPGAPEGPVSVGTMELAAEDIPYTLTLPGRAVAYEEADIRPRVSGAIEEVAYRPGQPVEAGDLLFRIEDDSYAAAVAAAEATVAGAEAGVATAGATVERYRSLEGSAITRAELETAEATLSQAQATLASAEAALTSTRLDLERTEIRSPIAGQPSVPQVSTGELVTANQAEALAMVTRLDPIYVDVTESSARMLRVRERIDEGSLAPGDEIGFRLVLETGAILEGEGTLVTPGTNVSVTTGTVDFRIQFDNPELGILPGQFLRVEATLGTNAGVLVPQRATSRVADGSLAAFVVVDGVARQVTLTTTGTHENSWIVTEGVEPGDLLIVDGLNNLRDGAEVEAVPVKIDEQGVVRDLAPEDGAAAPANDDGRTNLGEAASGEAAEGAQRADAASRAASPAAGTAATSQE